MSTRSLLLGRKSVFHGLYAPLARQPFPFNGLGTRVSRIRCRPHNSSASQRSLTPSQYQYNRMITWSFFAVSSGVFLSWDFADRGHVYELYNQLRRKISLPEISPQKVRRALEDRYMLTAGKWKNYFSFLGASVSHQNFVHFLFNMIAFTSLSGILAITLPPTHFVGLIGGSAIASSVAWLYTESNNPKSSRYIQRNALGSSGVVSAVVANAALFYPTSRMLVFFVVPFPMWATALAWSAYDYYAVTYNVESPIGHAAHLGGTAFGLLYYVLIGRRFGGILGPHRWR